MSGREHRRWLNFDGRNGKWLRHAGNRSASLAQDIRARYVRLVRFLFLILIGPFAILYP
jgi:hypothetical protein